MSWQSQPFIHPTAQLGEGVVVEPTAWIGPGSIVGRSSIIQANAVIGLGYVLNQTEPCIVGDGCIVGAGAVLYHTVIIDNQAKIWHNAVIRSHVRIGRGTSIGSLTCIEHDTSIGRGCSIHSLCHITDFSEVSDFVFVGPGFVSVSDINLDYGRPGLHTEYRGVTIGAKARIGGRVFAYPGSVIGEETVIGANSVVKGSLLPGVLYLGDPARPLRKVLPTEQFPLDGNDAR